MERGTVAPLSTLQHVLTLMPVRALSLLPFDGAEYGAEQRPKSFMPVGQEKAD